MADEQNEWLDRETAELLLCGESPEAVHPGSRKGAERLAAALDALSAPPGPQASSVSADAELPGVVAAVGACPQVEAEPGVAAAREAPPHG
ncbi:extensin, partial [Streptomyces olivaceus]